MRYLLDTNVCVMYLNGRSNAVRDRLISTPIEDMAVCSVVKSELFYNQITRKNQSVFKFDTGGFNDKQ